MAQAEQQRGARKGQIGAIASVAPHARRACPAEPILRSAYDPSNGRGISSSTVQPELDRLRHALRIAAELVISDPTYAPIFARLEEEIATLEAEAQNSVLTRARTILAKQGIGSKLHR